MRNLLTAYIYLLSTVLIAQDHAAEIPIPNPAQLAWQQAELGAVFHYDLHVFDGEKY